MIELNTFKTCGDMDGHTHVHEGCVDHSNSTHLQNKEGVLAGSHLGKQQAQRVSQCDGIFCGE